MDQVFKEGVRITATSAINEARNAALSALERLSPMMENLLRNDPPTLRLWQSARHVERYAAPRRAEPGTGAGDPSITTKALPSPRRSVMPQAPSRNRRPPRSDTRCARKNPEAAVKTLALCAKS